MKNITLEMSLKPFRKLEDGYIDNVCRSFFEQWKYLLACAESVSVLLWTADGSEILDYRGKLDDEIEWARYIGGANPRGNVAGDPEGLCLHSRYYLYTDKPVMIKYRDLKRIVAAIKTVGLELLNENIRVGATFDPGPEFAKSSFKYERHPEICLADSMGSDQNRFVACISKLKADNVSYAGFPDGIKEGMHIGTFLGRQTNCFLKDIGFDYIWLSNGFGFGTETWEVKGSLYDGSIFDPQKSKKLRESVIEFWQNFRKECPDYLVETRGTNLTTGVDLSTDAVDLKSIYEGGFNMTAPPNSPWAAIDGDFGLELAGYMSHIAELPLDNPSFPFRFYLHDPWWLNSPWMDRYEKCPHDIYMPLAVSRVNGKGDVETASSLELLTIDDSYGNMPLECPLEVTPHFREAFKTLPDSPSPFVWVYPFDQYHDMTFGQDPDLQEVFFGDWFIRDAINNSFPLNTVVSSDNFLKVLEAAPGKFNQSIIVTTLPAKGSDLAGKLLEFVNDGGDVLFYGPAKNADQDILDLLGIDSLFPVSGKLNLDYCFDGDNLELTQYPPRIMHEELMSGGGCCAVSRKGVSEKVKYLVTVSDGQHSRVYSAFRKVGSGSVGWLRGTNSGKYEIGGHLLKKYDPEKYMDSSILLRSMLTYYGYDFGVEKEAVSQESPSFCISRNKNAFYISGYSRNTNVGVFWKMLQGAPILTGLETFVSQSKARYRFLRAWHYECRVFVEQEEGSEISCREQISGQVGIKRRLLVKGLKNATLKFFYESGTQADVRMLHEPQWPFVSGDWIDFEIRDCELGKFLEAKNITGSVLISW